MLTARYRCGKCSADDRMRVMTAATTWDGHPPAEQRVTVRCTCGHEGRGAIVRDAMIAIAAPLGPTDEPATH